MSDSKESPTQQQQSQQQVPLEQVPIDSFPTALGLVYQYLNMATRRGAFQLDEAAKVMACLNFMGRVVQPRRGPPSQETQAKTQQQKPKEPNQQQQGIKRKG